MPSFSVVKGRMQKFDSNTLDKMRLVQDQPADEVIKAFFPQKKEMLQEHLSQLEFNRDLEKIKDDQWLGPLVVQMQAELNGKKELILEGQKFFNANASDVMLLLGFLSLPYCYGAANGAAVLVRSKRIIERPAERLAETAHFVFDIFHKNAFSPEGKALVSILKVRLMHAATRWYINKGEWDVEKLGKPVNQEDMAGTNLSFSLIVVRGLRRMGKLIRANEALAYIQYWNLVGKMLGLSDELIPANNKESHLLEKNIRKRQFRKSDAGVKLTDSLVKYYSSAAEGTPLEGKVKPMFEFLLGDSVAELLGLDLENYEVDLFRPYTLILKLQNQLLKKNDSYGMAWMNYQEQSKGLNVDSSFSIS